jgi:cytoskeletal protein RodZ
MDNNQVKKESGVGPIIGSIIIIILIVLGGLYFWGYILKNKTVEAPTNNPEQVEQVNSSEISDSEIAKINDDLNATSTDSIDLELNQIDAEIDAALQ